jgi:hypothetical protein
MIQKREETEAPDLVTTPSLLLLPPIHIKIDEQNKTKQTIDRVRRPTPPHEEGLRSNWLFPLFIVKLLRMLWPHAES